MIEHTIDEVMEFEFGILGDLDLSDDEDPSSQIAAQAYDLELQKQQESSFGAWETDTVGQLRQLLGEIVWELQPREGDYFMRLDVISRLSASLNSSEKFRGATISPFGSFESNFYTQWADLDLSLELPESIDMRRPIGKSQKVKALKLLMTILIKRAEAYKVQFIPYARVPLLTFKDSRCNISCDISVDNGVAILKSRLLRWVSEMDPRCRDLVFLVKCWAKVHCINDPKTGTLNSFALCLLVVFHLQTRSPPVLPPLNAVLHEDIARKLSGSNCQASREHLLNSCWEKIQPFVFNKFGAQNKSSVTELLVSFFYQFSSVTGLWSQGLAVCTFTGMWGDRTSTTSHWRSKHYVMAVEDPFDRLENCARSVQESTFPEVIRAFSSTADALYRPPPAGLPSLIEILFGWPVDTQQKGVRFWLSELHSREKKIGQEKALKRDPGNDRTCIQVTTGTRRIRRHKMEDRLHNDGTINDKGSNSRRSIDWSLEAKNYVKKKFKDVETNSQVEGEERLIVRKVKPQRGVTTVTNVSRRKHAEILVNDEGNKSEKDFSGASHEDLKGHLSNLHECSAGLDNQRHYPKEVQWNNRTAYGSRLSNDNAVLAEFESRIQGETLRTLGTRKKNTGSPLESSLGTTTHSQNSETNKAGTEIALESVQSQEDDEIIHTKAQFSNRKERRKWRKSRRGKRECMNLENLSLTSGIPFGRDDSLSNDIAPAMADSGAGQGETVGPVEKSLLNVQCHRDINVGMPTSGSSEMCKAEVLMSVLPNQRDVEITLSKQNSRKKEKNRWRKSNHTDKGSTSDGNLAVSMSHINIGINQTTETPCERNNSISKNLAPVKVEGGTTQLYSYRGKEWAHKVVGEDTYKSVAFDQEGSAHTSTDLSGHTVLAERLEGMSLSDVQNRSQVKVSREAYKRSKGGGELLWKRKLSDQ